MTMFNELRALYAIWENQHNGYDLECARLIWGLAHGFREYISAPIDYTDPNGEKKFYVSPQKVVYDNYGKITYIDPEYISDALAREESGYWTSAIVVKLDRGERTYPKTHFWFRIKFILRDKICELEIEGGQQKFKFDTSDTRNAQPLYDYMVDVLRKLMATPPWGIEKSPIGFEPPRATSQAAP